METFLQIVLTFQYLLLLLLMLFRKIVAQSARESTFLVKGVIEIILVSRISQV